MKIYESKNMANMASIVLVLSAVIGVVITFLFFQKYWYVLVLFITPLLLISLIMPELMSSLYSIKDGYLIKQMDKKHLNLTL
jgi:hypothetical protein